jgi:hypothetical protein
MRVTRLFLALGLAICPITWAGGEQLIPSAAGMTWNYQMTQIRPSPEIDLTEKTVQKENFDVSYRLGGTEKLDNVDYQKLEMYRDDVRASTDFIREEDNGIVCSARRDAMGALQKFNPAQKLVATPLEIGTKWRFDGKIGDTGVAQDYQIVGIDQVQVPAGKFSAWWIHCNQTAPTKATIDRWFVPGTGFIKIRTQIKDSSGDAVQETLLELKEPPAAISRAAPPTEQATEKLTVSVSKDPKGDAVKEFNVASPAIYARWQGHGLPAKAKVSAGFIAQNVADVTADYEIDDAEAVAPSPNSHGVFTLLKPETGWTPGTYRVEFSVNDEPAGAVQFKIAK